VPLGSAADEPAAAKRPTSPAGRRGSPLGSAADEPAAAPGADDFVVMSRPLSPPPIGDLEFLEEYWIGPFCLKICVGDLTRLGAEGWVSTDDAQLSMGGGVSAKIAARLGPGHRRDAAALAPAAVGHVVVTKSVRQPVRCVLHAITIGVDSAGRGVPPTLATVSSCVAEVFQHARRLGLRSLAIPSLGTGAGGLPPSEVAKVICGRAIEQLADRTNSTLQTIVFVTGSADDPLLAAIRSRVIETGPRELVVRRGAGPAPRLDLVPVD
jgi:O-acetyl-ADP-ribose deacetylase (regulator of RNase III)